MATLSHTKAVAAWLVQLAAAAAGNVPLADAKEKIAVMSGMLADDFPAPAFTAESRRAVALRTDFFPSYGALHKLLAEWWDANRPRSTALPSQLAEAQLSSSDRAGASAWLNAAAGSASAGELIARLDVIRGKQEAAFRWLVANNDHARNIAAAKGWEVRDGMWDGLDHPGRLLAQVRAIIDPPHPMAKMLLGILRAAVERHAPQNLGLVPSDASQTFSADPAAARAPTPVQRQAINADDGIVVMKPPTPAPTSSVLPNPPAVLSDAQLLAIHEQAGNTVRVAALRARIAAAAANANQPPPAERPA